MSEPLNYLPRSELQYQIMCNIEDEIMSCSKNNKLRFWWERTPNWVKVQKYINRGTCKMGSTSSGRQCEYIGIEPDDYFIQEKYRRSQK